jgi:shikimate dehydrogenase
MKDKKTDWGLTPLEKLREEMDALDRELSLLLQKRLDLVTRIADYKKENHIQVLDRGREEKVIENVLSVLQNPQYAQCLKLTYEGIMAQSREFQTKRLSSSSTSPKKYALIGEKLSHSLSPRIHSLFFEKAGLNATYNLKEVPRDQLAGLLDRLKEEGYAGINITIPYKTELMSALNFISDEARNIGAVNTILLGEEYRGYNTDYYGFGMALDHHGLSYEGKRCAVLGSGGSSRAVIAFLKDHGASEIHLVTRNPQEAKQKFPDLPCTDIKAFTASGFDLVVNTTPVGMSSHSQASPLTEDQLKGAGAVMDLIYNPKETVLLSYCRALGIPCANGLFMLVAQALCAQEIWQGYKVSPGMIEEIYEELNRS